MEIQNIDIFIDFSSCYRSHESINSNEEIFYGKAIFGMMLLNIPVAILK